MKNNALFNFNFRRQAGFSMMEILASVIVFSVGLSGMAAQSLSSLRAAADGQFHSQATIIAEEVADTMRANLAAYETAKFASTPATGSASCGASGECSFTEEAQYDSAKWLAHVADALPQGAALMCMDSTPNDGQPAAPACDGNGMNTVKIFWIDSRASDALGEGETFQRYSMSLIP